MSHRRRWLLLAALFLVSGLPLRDAARAPSLPAPTPASASRVELVALVEPERVVRYVESLGGTVEVSSGDRVQALVPDSTVDDLSAARGLVQVEEPAIFVPLQIADPSALLGIPPWRDSGFSGQGVRVAVVDSGFRGYAERSGTSLPADVTPVSFRADGDIEAGTDHGTLAAEIVHSIAPSAEIYLVNFSTVTELSAAVDYLIAEGVDVISFSLGFIHNGPGNGTGPVADIVSKGTVNDALWTVSAGNWARQHWRGPFLDLNDDSLHEFAPGELVNGRTYEVGDLIVVSLRWDDEWGASCSDYDLELFGPNGALVRASRRVQSCSGNPVESLQVLATDAGRYSVRIIEARSDEPKVLHLLMVGSPDRGATLDTFSSRVLARGARGPPERRRGRCPGKRRPLARRCVLLARPDHRWTGKARSAVTDRAGRAGVRRIRWHLSRSATCGGARGAASRGSPGPRGGLHPRVAHRAGAHAEPGSSHRCARAPRESRLTGRLWAGAAAGRGGGDADGDRAPGGRGPRAGGVPGTGRLSAPLRAPADRPRRASAYFRFDEETQSFDHYIVGAPSRVQSFMELTDNTPYVIRYAAP